MDLYDINNINRILSKHGFTFSKALGQNFLIDKTVCPQMAEQLKDQEKNALSAVDNLGSNNFSNMGVIEIGPGIGVLTKELSAVAKRVIAIEVDKRLLPVLEESLSDCENVEIIHGDVMKLDLKQLILEKFADCENVKVCANLPYYITSPVIMTLLEENLPIKEIVVMVQKEAAERLCAKVGSRDSGAVTVAVNYYAKSEMLFEVKRESFMPAPKVDSAVIKLKIRETPAVDVSNVKHFFSLVKACFAQRRKTAVNSISSTMGIPKSDVSNAIQSLGLDVNIRAEKFTMNQLADLSKLI